MTLIRTTAIAVIAATFAATAGVAVADPVVKRKAIMKEVVLKNTKLAGGMVRGKLPFDQGKAVAAMTAMAGSADAFVKLFPAGSDEDPESEASPKVWSDMKGFLAASNQFKVDATAAIAAAKAGEGAFKGAFGKVVANCKACHQDYRIKKN